MDIELEEPINRHTPCNDREAEKESDSDGRFEWAVEESQDYKQGSLRSYGGESIINGNRILDFCIL